MIKGNLFYEFFWNVHMTRKTNVLYLGHEHHPYINMYWVPSVSWYQTVMSIISFIIPLANFVGKKFVTILIL